MEYDERDLDYGDEPDERELEYGDERDLEYGDERDLDDDDLNEYRTPDDEEYIQGDGGDDVDEFVPESDSRIDTGAEWRDYGDGISKSRVGIARAIDIDEDLGTMTQHDTFNRLERISRSPEDMFRIIARKTKERYKIQDGIYDDSLRVLQYMRKRGRKVKFKNPSAILFALLCLKDGKIVKGEISSVYEKMARHEKMTETDLVRYIFFVKDVLEKR